MTKKDLTNVLIILILYYVYLFIMETNLYNTYWLLPGFEVLYCQNLLKWNVSLQNLKFNDQYKWNHFYCRKK